MTEKDIQDITGLVLGSRDAVVCSVDENGFPNAKSMFLSKNEDLRIFWFSTNISAMRTAQWKINPKACVYISDPENIRGVMLTGKMKVYEDAETKLKFWKPGDERYYHLGPTDPDYCMICFTAETGSYYSGPRKYMFSAEKIKLLNSFHYNGKWEKNT